MKIRKIKINQKLLIEFISVTFAVFLGLMLNQWKDNQNNQNLANQSSNSIRAEIDRNNVKVKEMIESHEIILSRLDSIITLTEAERHDNVSLKLNFQIINSTSWETAKLTQAIAHMDINNVSEIADVYHYQNYYESIVKEYVTRNIYIKADVNDSDYLENMRSFLSAIIPVEKNLRDYYNEILKKL